MTTTASVDPVADQAATRALLRPTSESVESCEVDWAKVAWLRAEIASGRYSVSAGRLAERLLLLCGAREAGKAGK